MSCYIAFWPWLSDRWRNDFTAILGDGLILKNDGTAHLLVLPLWWWPSMVFSTFWDGRELELIFANYLWLPVRMNNITKQIDLILLKIDIAQVLWHAEGIVRNCVLFGFIYDGTSSLILFWHIGLKIKESLKCCSSSLSEVWAVFVPSNLLSVDFCQFWSWRSSATFATLMRHKRKHLGKMMYRSKSRGGGLLETLLTSFLFTGKS